MERKRQIDTFLSERENNVLRFGTRLCTCYVLRHLYWWYRRLTLLALEISVVKPREEKKKREEDRAVGGGKKCEGFVGRGCAVVYDVESGGGGKRRRGYAFIAGCTTTVIRWKRKMVVYQTDEGKGSKAILVLFIHFFSLFHSLSFSLSLSGSVFLCRSPDNLISCCSGWVGAT